MSAPPVEMLLFLLRKAVFSEATPDYAALLPLLRQTLAFLERENPDSPATDGYTSDLAHLTAAMVEESRSSGVLRAGLEILLRLGRVGESLAVSFAGKDILPPEHLVAVFGALPAAEKHLLANALLRFPRKTHPEVSRFATSVLETAIDQEPDDVLVLCDTLRLRDEPPSTAVRNECLHGRLGIWLSQLVKMDLYPEQTEFMARMAAVLRSAPLAEPLLLKEGGLSSQAVGDVCRAVADHPCPVSESCIAALTGLLAAREPAVILAVMETLCQVAPEQAIMLAAGLPASRPDARFVLFALSFFLPRALLPAFLRAMPADLRPRFLISFLWVLARCNDAGLAPLLKHLRQQASTSAAATAMSDVLTEILRQASFPVPPRPRRITATPPSESEAEGLLGRLKSLVGMHPEGAGRTAASPLDDAAPGAGLSELRIIGGTHHGKELRDVAFTRVHLESLDLSRCVMARVVFRDCRIRKVDFTLARLAGVHFEACRLEHCRFSGMAARGLVFSGCDMTGVCLGDCEAREVRLSACTLRDCDCFGARFADFQALESRFESANFSHAAFSRARFQGVDLTDCTIQNTLFQGLEAVCCHGRGTYLSRCAFQDLKSDDPLFLAAELRSGRDLFLDRIQTDNSEPDPAFLQKESLSLATRLIENWSFDMETRLRRVTVLAHNRRRLDWTMEKLGEEDTQFLRCLPDLLEAPKTWTPAGWIAAVPGTIPGHHPTFEAGRALRQIMGEACPPHVPSKKGVTISGVFSMGSLGTVAQTPSSDLDIWVCLGDDEITLRLKDRFRKKLDGLRALAASRGMETHFFVMTEADVRENRLGLGDEEECGLARAMLLKEEFLRTALFLAGRKPAWWYVAPGADLESYRHAVSRLVRPEAPAAFEAMDMGPVDRMAGGFFGASLWTIVKSLENPFKSVMKFALLEKYLSSGAARTLLCDRIKKHLFAGRTGLLDTDPYILLLDEVRGFHESQGNSEALALMRLAFTQKTGIDPGDLGASRTDAAGHACGEGLFRAQFFFDLDECRAVRPTGTADRQPASSGGSIAELTVAGKKIADFLFGTYERLRARLSMNESMIGSEADQRDLTILGRRIFSRFGTRKNKIARIPFVRPPHGLIHSLEIVFDGPEQGFTARGECRRPDGRKVPEHIRSEPSLERLAGWLTANDFHRPGVYLKAGAIKAPLSFPDVQALLAALRETFSLRETFNPPLAEGLVAERLVKALVLINFHAPREEKEIVEAGFYYSNNWGELFYVDKAQALDLLVTAPHDFLRYNTGLDVDGLARIETLFPVKASCPRLKLSFYA